MEQKQSHGNAKGTGKQGFSNKSEEQLLKKDPTNNELLEQKQVEDTPFTAVRVQDKWFLTMGKYRLTEQLNTYEECVDASKDASWWRIMQIINIMIKEHDNEKNKPEPTIKNQLTIN